MRERSFCAFLKGSHAPAVTGLELQIQSSPDMQPLDWPQLPALRHLVVKCAPVSPLSDHRTALRRPQSAQIRKQFEYMMSIYRAKVAQPMEVLAPPVRPDSVAFNCRD